MRVGQYYDKDISAEYKDVANARVYDIMKALHKYSKNKFYVTQEKKPIYMLKACNIFENVLKNELGKTLEELMKINPVKLNIVDASTDLLSAYNVMRKNKLDEIIVVNEKGELLGDIDFKTISLKLADLATKDEITGDFNEKYFHLFLDEYQKFTDEEIGFICVFIQNADFIEDFYGVDKYHQVLKYYSALINRTIRDVDFVFRIDNRFIIATFNPLDIVDKIFERIKNNLTKVEGDYANLEFKISHFPTLGMTIDEALDKCAPEGDVF